MIISKLNNKILTQNKILILAILLILAFVLAFFVINQSLYPVKINSAIAATNLGGKLSGYAWSNVGWISFSGKATNGQPYGVEIDKNGNLSGNAWSDRVGWISFNRADTSNPPIEPFNNSSSPIAKIDANGNVIGWARALSACVESEDEIILLTSPCYHTNKGSLDGWAGWIKLSGVAASGDTYQVKLDKNTNTFTTGKAWSSTVVGWISMSGKTEKDEPYAIKFEPDIVWCDTDKDGSPEKPNADGTCPDGTPPKPIDQITNTNSTNTVIGPGGEVIEDQCVGRYGTNFGCTMEDVVKCTPKNNDLDGDCILNTVTDSSGNTITGADRCPKTPGPKSAKGCRKPGFIER